MIYYEEMIANEKFQSQNVFAMGERNKQMTWRTTVLTLSLHVYTAYTRTSPLEPLFCEELED